MIIIYARQESVNRCTKKPAKHQKFRAPTRLSQADDFRKYLSSQKKTNRCFYGIANEKFVLPSERERERIFDFRACLILCMYARVIASLWPNKKL